MPLDQFISNRKWELAKIWIVFPVPVVYLIFNVIYWAAGGMVNQMPTVVYIGGGGGPHLRNRPVKLV